MNPFTPEDQKLVPIPIVDNLISEIHQINDAIKRFSPQRPSYHKAIDARRNDCIKVSHEYSLRDQIKEAAKSNTNAIAERINNLHAKLDKSITRSIVTLSRSRSPQRTSYNRTEESPVSRSFIAEKPKSSVPSFKYERSSSLLQSASNTNLNDATSARSYVEPYSPARSYVEPYSATRDYSASPTRNSRLGRSYGREGFEKVKKSGVFSTPVSDLLVKQDTTGEARNQALSKSMVGSRVSAWPTGLNSKIKYDEQKVNKVVCDIIMRNAKLDASPAKRLVTTEKNQLYRSYI